MSALRAPADAPSRPTTSSRRTRLTAIDGGRAEGRRFAAVRAPLQARSAAPFLVLCGGLLLAALLAVLVLNTTIAYGSYEMSRLQSQSSRLSQDIQIKQQSLRSAENDLARRAAQLGMVPSEGTTMLDISDAVAAAGASAEAGQPAAEDGQPAAEDGQ